MSIVMRVTVLALFLGAAAFCVAKTVDCGVPCQSIYSTDIEGAIRFGLRIDTVTLNDPPITRIEIDQSKNSPCSFEWVDLAIGESHSGLGSEAIVSINAIPDISGISVKNHLIDSSKRYIGISCSDSDLRFFWKGSAHEHILSIQLWQ